MSFYVGTFKKQVGMNIDKTIKVFVDNGNFLLTEIEKAEKVKTTINKGDWIIDPITDDEVEIISCSSNGFYVKDVYGNKKIIPLKDGILTNR